MQAVEPQMVADGTTLENVAGTWRVKDAGLAATKLAASAVDDATLERYDSGGGVYKLRTKAGGIGATQLAAGLGSSAVLGATTATGIPNGTTDFFPMGGGLVAAVTSWVVARAGTIRRLRAVNVNALGVGETLVFVLRLNGVNQALTVTIPASSGAGTEVADDVNSFEVAAGDNVLMRVTSTDAQVNGGGWAFEYVPNGA
jgi:hypothetical protein